MLIERRNHIEEEKKTLQELEWVRTSNIMATILNSVGGKKGGTAYQPEEFYKPSWIKEDVIESVEEVPKEEILSKFPKTLNGK